MTDSLSANVPDEMTPRPTTFPNRAAAAAHNRDAILNVARDAFAAGEPDVSMAEIARRAGVGMATLYRNFPGRRELLEALYADEVEALCRAAGGDGTLAPGAAFTDWLRRMFAFLPGKRLLVSELLRGAEAGDPEVAGRRGQALEAGRPLLATAQAAGEVRDDVTLEQIFDLVVAIAGIPGDAAYLEPMLETLLDGLRGRRDGRSSA